jgi:hypothetical protein
MPEDTIQTPAGALTVPPSRWTCCVGHVRGKLCNKFRETEETILHTSGRTSLYLRQGEIGYDGNLFVLCDEVNFLLRIRIQFVWRQRMCHQRVRRNQDRTTPGE